MQTTPRQTQTFPLTTSTSTSTTIHRILPRTQHNLLLPSDMIIRPSQQWSGCASLKSASSHSLPTSAPNHQLTNLTGLANCKSLLLPPPFLESRSLHHPASRITHIPPRRTESAQKSAWDAPWQGPCRDGRYQHRPPWRIAGQSIYKTLHGRAEESVPGNW